MQTKGCGFVFFCTMTFNVFLLHSIGPLVTCWCMRMEAKNSYFKRIGQIGNFKNIAYSVAKRHQRLMCAYLLGKFFSYDELECGPCELKYSVQGNCVHATYT